LGFQGRGGVCQRTESGFAPATEMAGLNACHGTFTHDVFKTQQTGTLL
jgi:hypothetical protein